MAHGIELAGHYAGEALRLHAAGASDPTLMLAQRALAWCQAQPGGIVALADLYRKGPRAIRDAATARRVVDILVDHGWLTGVPDGAEVAGSFAGRCGGCGRRAMTALPIFDPWAELARIRANQTELSPLSPAFAGSRDPESGGAAAPA